MIPFPDSKILPSDLILSLFSLHHQFSSCLLTIMLAHIFYPLRIIQYTSLIIHLSLPSFKFHYLRFTSSLLYLVIRLSKLPRKVCSLTKVSYRRGNQELTTITESRFLAMSHLSSPQRHKETVLGNVIYSSCEHSLY